jgi:CheY-like chemotaxis protein
MNTLSALVVEDDSELREIFADILMSFGVAVQQAGDGKLALNWLAQATPDVLILDLHLPGVSGLEILNRVRKDSRLQHIEVVVVTADSVLSTVVQEQADFVLMKPLDFRQLNTLFSRLAS